MKVLVPVLLLGALALVYAPSQGTVAANAPDGAVIFKQRCQICHSDVAGQPAKIGPNLSGVVGRKAAAEAFNYSDALKNSGLTWTKANLDRFLTSPAKTVPGTRMAITITDPAQRQAVIDYLAQKH